MRPQGLDLISLLGCASMSTGPGVIARWLQLCVRAASQVDERVEVLEHADRSIGIDRLRAIAILWVVFYHFDVLPVDGTHGVLLFFIISGFCISLSADASRSGWHFYAKRLGRLLPALVLCGFITTAGKHIAPSLVEPGRMISWSDYFYTLFALPTLNVIRKDYLPPDGSYWSLIVEFQFYLICAFIIGLGLRKHLIPLLCAITVLRTLTGGGFGNDFFAFFIAGLSAAAAVAGRTKEAAMGVAVAATIELYHLWQRFPEPMSPITWERSRVLWIGTAAVYLAAIFRPKDNLAAHFFRGFAVLGLISYPLYLIHQDVGRMLINLSGPETMAWSGRVYRAVVLGGSLSALCWLIYMFVEKPLIRPLTDTLAPKPARRASASRPCDLTHDAQ